jgi:hypothetical protein
MTKTTRLLVALAGLAGLLAMPAAASAQAPRTLTVNLQAAMSGGDPRSGVNGTATLTDIGGGRTRVDIRVTVGPGGSANMPGHVHAGRCPNVGAVVHPLNNVMNGASTTEINASIADLLAGTFAINLHRSPQEANVWVSCGNVVAVGLPATGHPGLPALPLLAGSGALLAGAAAVIVRRRR